MQKDEGSWARVFGDGRRATLEVQPRLGGFKMLRGGQEEILPFCAGKRIRVGRYLRGHLVQPSPSPAVAGNPSLVHRNLQPVFSEPLSEGDPWGSVTGVLRTKSSLLEEDQLTFQSSTQARDMESRTKTKDLAGADIER